MGESGEKTKQILKNLGKKPSTTPQIPSRDILIISTFSAPFRLQITSGCSETAHKYTERSKTERSTNPQGLP